MVRGEHRQCRVALRRQQLVELGQQTQGIQRAGQRAQGHPGMAFFQRHDGAGTHAREVREVALRESPSAARERHALPQVLQGAARENGKWRCAHC